MLFVCFKKLERSYDSHLALTIKWIITKTSGYCTLPRLDAVLAEVYDLPSDI
jgi:hypothetical protein